MKLDFFDKNEVQEIFLRRNIFVHNDGIINNIYLSKINKNIFNFNRNDNAKLDKDYIINTINLLEKNFIIVVLKLWAMALDKNKEDRKEYFAFANEINFDYLLKEQWNIAKGISKLLMNDKKADESQKLIATLNYYQSCKWLNDNWEQEKINYQALDFSAKEPMFKLANYAMLDQYDVFLEFFDKHYGQKGISYEELHDWPIYRGIRNSYIFQKIKKRSKYKKYLEEKLLEFKDILNALKTIDEFI